MAETKEKMTDKVYTLFDQRCFVFRKHAELMSAVCQKDIGNNNGDDIWRLRMELSRAIRVNIRFVFEDKRMMQDYASLLKDIYRCYEVVRVLHGVFPRRDTTNQMVRAVDCIGLYIRHLFDIEDEQLANNIHDRIISKKQIKALYGLMEAGEDIPSEGAWAHYFTSILHDRTNSDYIN